MSGITLVVSPLISLMKDQVGALNQAGVHAAYINSSLTDNQIAKALAFAKQGRYKIIYVAPERLETWGFLDFATHVEISMITVDEAHCISQWGQDFRPSYLNILSFVKKLARRPIISAFTATATSKVRDDILQILSLEKPVILTTGFDRSNLTFKVKHIKDKDSYILDYLVSHRQDSGIIYCATRKNVEKVIPHIRLCAYFLQFVFHPCHGICRQQCERGNKYVLCYTGRTYNRLCACFNEPHKTESYQGG